ncbi:hypothetical protein CCZ01_08085 [Helicobacter monodelphidis]|nr:hypothetical protein CCZ01_08085 [Helicobacter sp. 15-1451]
MEQIAEKFKAVEGEMFVYDTTPRMSKELMEEAFVIIGHGSSVVQTFPLTTFKPAILFMPDKEFFTRNSLDSKFVANEKTHILAHSVDEILEICQQLQRDSQAHQQEIKAYREEHIYNLGRSNQFIANFIEKLVLKVQNDKKHIGG